METDSSPVSHILPSESELGAQLNVHGIACLGS